MCIVSDILTKSTRCRYKKVQQNQQGTGIEPVSSAWKAVIITIIRTLHNNIIIHDYSVLVNYFIKTKFGSRSEIRTHTCVDFCWTIRVELIRAPAALVRKSTSSANWDMRPRYGIWSWKGYLDLHEDKKIQSLLCCCYTISLHAFNNSILSHKA